MLIKLKSGLSIAIPPIFPWESRSAAVLKIRSGRAFYPDHVTTRLCLDLLDSHFTERIRGSLLDVGCGCGILALAAARLGAPVVVGLDIDIEAVRKSQANARTNSLEGACRWLAGTTAAVSGGFDCIAANLPCHVLIEVVDDLSRLLNSASHLILSGFQDIDWPILNRKLAVLGLSVQRLLSGDRAFYGIPPSGSFTWMAVLLAADEVKACRNTEGR